MVPNRRAIDAGRFRTRAGVLYEKARFEVIRMNGMLKYVSLRIGLSVLLVTAGCAAPKIDADPKLSGDPLVDLLRAGGHNIYFRHAQTDWSQSDRIDRAGDWTSCDRTRVRQLSAEGRRTARAVGDAIRALGIPVGKILASPYCRTVETAKLMDLGPVETTTDVMNLRVAEYFGGRDAILKRARSRLAVPPPPHTNVVLVAHGNVARDATEIYPDEAEGVIFRPDGNGGFVFVDRLTPDHWTALANKFVDGTGTSRRCD